MTMSNKNVRTDPPSDTPNNQDALVYALYLLNGADCECDEMTSIQQLRLRPPNFWTGFTAALKHMMVFHSFARGDDLLLRLDFKSKNAKIILPKFEH